MVGAGQLQKRLDRLLRLEVFERPRRVHPDFPRVSLVQRQLSDALRLIIRAALTSLDEPHDHRAGIVALQGSANRSFSLAGFPEEELDGRQPNTLVLVFDVGGGAEAVRRRLQVSEEREHVAPHEPALVGHSLDHVGRDAGSQVGQPAQQLAARPARFGIGQGIQQRGSRSRAEDPDHPVDDRKVDRLFGKQRAEHLRPLDPPPQLCHGRVLPGSRFQGIQQLVHASLIQQPSEAVIDEPGGLVHLDSHLDQAERFHARPRSAAAGPLDACAGSRHGLEYVGIILRCDGGHIPVGQEVRYLIANQLCGLLALLLRSVIGVASQLGEHEPNGVGNLALL